ncbi:MAG: hypothetical protein FJ352_01290, partial [Firmicutes bacterium]|nr:hypothetical protein [Bacillota bacterium]
MKRYRFSIYLLLGLITLSACNNSSSSNSISSSNSNSTTTSSITDVSISEITFRLRGDNVVNYANHALWIWEDGFDGELFIFTQSDAYGGYITLPIDTWETRSKLNYIVRPATTWAGQSPDTSIFFTDFYSFITAEGEMNVYLILGESEYYFTEADATGDRITGAYFSSWNRIEIQTNAAFTSYEILADEDVIATGGAGNNGLQAPLTSDADISLLYRVRVKFKPTDTKTKIRTVLANRLFETTKFNQEFTYAGSDLGLTFNASEAIFKVWAPTSQKIR